MKVLKEIHVGYFDSFLMKDIRQISHWGQAVCRVTAPSHYLNQCWQINSEALWHSPEVSFIGNTLGFHPWYEFDNYWFKVTAASPRCQWVNRCFFIQIWCDLIITPEANTQSWHHDNSWFSTQWTHWHLHKMAETVSDISKWIFLIKLSHVWLSLISIFQLT